MKNNYNFKSRIVAIVGFLMMNVVAFTQTTLINPLAEGGFELGADFTSNGWNVSNIANNPWVVGTAVTNGAITGNSAYISNDAGVTHAYTNTAIANNFFWRDVTVPAGETKIILNFNWICQGESTWDNWQVFVAPTTVIPTSTTIYPGNGAANVPAGIAGATFVGNGNLLGTVQTATYILPSSLAGTTFRLIFSWKNDGSLGAQPPAVIDNVSLVSQLPGTFISVVTGNWNDPLTWDANAVPTAADNAIIDNGHVVTINAAGIAINDLEVRGTLGYGATPTTFNVNGNLTVNVGGLFNVFNATTGKTLIVSKNILNNGTIDISVGATTAGNLTLNGSTVQTVSGTGVFNNGFIRNITCSNTNTATPNINWGMDVRVAYNLNITGARINLGSSKITFGNNAAGNTLTAPIGTGFLPGGKFSRWWTTGATGTAITAGTDPANVTSRYPFINAAGQNRAMYISRSSATTTGNTAGELAVVYTDGTGMTSSLSILDGAYTITDRYNGYWNVTDEGSGYVYVSGTHTVVPIAQGAYVAANGNSRVMTDNAAIAGAHQNGTLTPAAQRTGLTTADITVATGLYIGANMADIVQPCTTPVGGTTTGPASVCSGVNFTLSLTGATTGVTGLTYQWQSSSDGVSYSNITGATATTYVANQTASTYYQCIITCTNGGATDISAPLQVNMSSFINCYCSANLTTNSNGIDIITNMVLTNSIGANLTQASGAVAPNYVMYNNIPLNLIPSSTNNTLAITMGTDGTQWSAAWIDWNQDGVFSASENIALATVAAGGSATVTYTFTVPASATLGNTRMRVRGGSDGAYTAAGACTTTAFGETEDYLVNIVALPSNPPTPLQDPTSPTCASGTDLTVPGIPAVDEAWYWQTSANGTSTANPVSGAYTVFLNGTYYVRTFNSIYGIWSLNSDSVIVSNIPLAPLPPTPTAAASPACISTTISVATAPAGTAYFWQGTTVNGIAITDDASTPYTVNASGTYHVSAYDSLTSCWSNTNSVAILIDTFIPQVPVASAAVTICAGEPSAIISGAVAASGTQTVSFGLNLACFGPAAVYNATIPALPAGATITGTQLEIINATALGGSFRSEMRVALSGAITLPATQISALTSAGLITPNPLLNVANPPIGGGAITLTLTETFDDGGAGTQDASYGEVRLIITYTLPPTILNWYDASVAGTLQGTGSPYETVGSPYLPNTSIAGTYTFYAEAVSGACVSTTRNSVSVIINALPQMVLNDSVACANTSVLLDAHNTGSTYLWNTTDTAQTISVNTDGLYYVDITTAQGCVARDSMNLTIYSLPVVDLGADVSFCDGDNITLDAGNTGMDFVWNTTEITQSIVASVNGMYSVTVTNLTTSCSNVDSIMVTVNPNPAQNLGNDIAQCGLSPILLDAGTGDYTFLWNDNSTNQTLLVNTSGTYSVLVNDTITGCFGMDTISIAINPLPVVDLGVDSTQCGGAIVLDAQNTGSTYLWSDNSSSQTLAATATGTYSVVVTNAFNCSAIDSIDVTINFLPVVNLGVDTAQCGGSIVLDAGNPGMDYLWNNSSTSQTITLFISGNYSVTVTDTITGCSSSDAINIVIGSIPVVSLGNDTTQCGGVITLNAQNTGLNYLWSTSATTQTIVVNTSGTYHVTVSNSDGCSTNDTIVVTLHALPGVGLLPFSNPICNDLTSFVLTGGNPSGGVYSGNTVVGNSFDPSTAGVGIHPITYTVTDVNGCSNSSTQNITVNSCVGVEEYSVLSSTMVYPNPSNGMFTIAIANATIDNLIISIIDIQGKEVFGVKETNVHGDYNKHVNLEGLSKGMYYIKLSTDKEAKIQKLIVQ
ncbi:MAG: T9SS type A sorting domain-containing protein [Bacteroidia bacterium]|nr:T9SS type A sorting domain-containing protein [Bacteroidia bacterium]